MSEEKKITTAAEEEAARKAEEEAKKAAEKARRAAKYREQFEQLRAAEEEISCEANGKRVKLTKVDGELKGFFDIQGDLYKNPENWRQVYSPDVRSRQKFPEYLFISTKGNIVSLYRQPRLLNTDERFINSEKRRQWIRRFLTYGNNNHINIHNLLALVYSDIIDTYTTDYDGFNIMRLLLNDLGQYVFGDDAHSNTLNGFLQVHHKNPYTPSKELCRNNPDINDIANLRVLPIGIHKYISHACDNPKDIQELYNLLDEIGKHYNYLMSNASNIMFYLRSPEEEYLKRRGGVDDGKNFADIWQEKSVNCSKDAYKILEEVRQELKRQMEVSGTDINSDSAETLSEE